MRDLLARWVRRLRFGESGQAAVLLAVVMVPLIGAAALTIDVSKLLLDRQLVRNAVDAGALAGAQSLPGNAALAQSKAIEFVLANAPSLTVGDIDVSFRCLVGDRNHDGIADAADIPAACNPGGDAVWRVAGGLAVSPCVPAQGDTCNVIVVQASGEVDFVFAPVVGVDRGGTGDLSSAACRGLCGGSPSTPIDLVLLIDRTGSMSSADITNARNAARALLGLYDPALQWVALGLLGPTRTSGATCSGANSPARANAASSAQYAAATWVPVALTGVGAPLNQAYKNADGTLNTSSTIVKAITCFDTSSTGTNLSAPMRAATDYLLANGREGVRKGIIIETDGTPNGSGDGPASDYTCSAAASAAAAAKAAGIEVVTIGFGIAAGDRCPDSSGAYRNVATLQLLADRATTSTNGGCNDAENADGDRFFCAPRTTQLDAIFRSAASVVAASPRLVTLP